MQLFDILHKLNSEISVMMNQGMPGKDHPQLTAKTDGFGAQILFLDKVVWDSTKWDTGTYSHAVDDEDAFKYESKRIEAHIKKEVADWIDTLYYIQWN